ncbi:MAG: type II secretion system protein GspN [Leptospirillia bacterium]
MTNSSLAAEMAHLLTRVRRSFFSRNREPNPETTPSTAPRPRLGRRSLLLGTIGAVVFAGGLAQGFPHRELARYLLGEASRKQGVALSAGSARFDLPARLSYRDLVLVAPTPAGPATVTVDRAYGSLLLSSLTSGKPRINFRLRAYGGLFEGHLRRLPHAENHLKGATVTPVDLRLTEPVLHQKIGGTLTLNTDYTWQAGQETKGHGVFVAMVQHLVLSSLSVGGFPLPPVAFDAVRSRVFVSGGRGRVERLQAVGPLADINGGGTFTLATPYQNSLLHLRLNIRLKGALASIPLPGVSGQSPVRQVILTLDGPAQNLNIAMNGLPIPH